MADESNQAKLIYPEVRVPLNLPGDAEIVKLILAFLRSTWGQANQIANEIVQAVRDSLNGHGKGENAAALAEWRGAAHGLALLEGLEPPSWLAGSYLWSAVLADLHRRSGHTELAARHRDAALASAPSASVKEALQRRLGGF